MADGRRRIQLTGREREEFAQRETVEHLVSMFLDLERRYTREQMCDDLGITLRQLKTLTNTELFKEIYEDHFDELGHDPRLRAVQAGITDLLPVAFIELRRALTSQDVPWTVKYKAIMDVMKLNGIQPKPTVQSDRRELAEFLGTLPGIVVENMNVAVLPDGYEDAVDAAEAGDVIDIQPTNIPDEPTVRIIEPPTGDPARIVAK